MTSLQLGLIVAGVALVIGVLIYNWLVERRVRRRIREAFRDTGGASPTMTPRVASGRGSARIEPTLAQAEVATVIPENPPAVADAGIDDAAYEAPLEIQARIATDLAALPPVPPTPRPVPADADLHMPDPDIECVVTLQPVHPVSAGSVAAGLHARIGKPLRWFGRSSAEGPWQLLRSDTPGSFTEIAACLLLANRSGAASKDLIDAFSRLAGSVASSLPAAYVPPDSASEAERAEALDRLCADLDVQIGLTLLKTGATIAGTRLRGVAEAAGFKLGDAGRFEWTNDETGALLYSLANYHSEPFSAEALRSVSTPGVVFLLDVPRVADAPRVFDQMKLAAKRMAKTLDAVLCDDNRRLLDDAALATIREQVRVTAAALSEVNIEPGSPRALALFGG